MKKENKNIFLHIIDEDYKAKEQTEKIDVSKKAILLIEPKDTSVAKRLRKILGNFAASKEPEWPESIAELNQIKPQDPCESTSSLDVSELYLFYQKVKAEGQELTDRKQDLLSMERDLREKLLREICKKKKANEVLHLEISALQNTCREISQSLLPTTE